MPTRPQYLPLRTAALIAGLALLGSVVAAPFAEMYVFPKLIIPYKAAETARNILAHQGLFTAGLLAYFLTFLLDIVIAWALYHLLRSVHPPLAQFTAWLKLAYSLLALVALNQLVTALRLLTTPDYLALFPQAQVQALAMVHLRAFKNHWYFGLIVFALHLVLLGYLVFRSGYIPRVFGVLLVITGLGYLLTAVRPYLFPELNVDFAMYTFYGEPLFMLWLLIRGNKFREEVQPAPADFTPHHA
ncbi:DUF4386 domain-containing protein [Hymenobacter sp. 15J16-1T3B]|uniref:DUF4386 domain-containing protein n=1 Tax=Hymenobacter sp. 15J16-1T3B TaxID=2886941 RepID=UPI001D107AB2|nr:DUF4386 domain-containing protein [Hymenobacter sp. 15J16-1T3B]MCC3157992.1 DUF4386 domain-containing protein [Hymenobacter sp. 15J16-1T3B]